MAGEEVEEINNAVNSKACRIFFMVINFIPIKRKMVPAKFKGNAKVSEQSIVLR